MLIRNYRLGPRLVRSVTSSRRINPPPRAPLFPFNHLAPTRRPTLVALFKARTQPFNVPKSHIFAIIIHGRCESRVPRGLAAGREAWRKKKENSRSVRATPLNQRPAGTCREFDEVFSPRPASLVSHGV